MGQYEKYLGKKLDGRYELREIIGIGGMAVVYSALDLQTQQPVAVKLLKDEYLASDEFRRRFKTESKAISVLSHPNIVNVHDVCLGDRLQYIVMELVDGITLKEYLEIKRTLSWRDSLYFLSQILSALAHAHEKGIVHRDIKPQNIMLLQSGLIKVADFGIARFARSNSDTMTNRAIGSVHYISPEQARGDAVDARGDLYSVGVMLYEMLTGRLPFNADSAVQVALMQMQADPVPPRQINPDIPEGLEDIVLKAMQKNPDNRYQSAAEMLAAVEELKRNPSISFAYKYFDDNAPKHVSEAIDSSRKSKKEEKRAAVIGMIKQDGGRKKRKVKAEKDNGGEYKSRWLGILFGVTLATVIATMLFVGISVWLRTTLLTPSGAEVDLPNFVGLTLTDIENESAYNVFEIVIDWDNSGYSDEYATNTVYEQSPSPPKKVKEGSTITLKVSRGPELIALPDFSTREKNAVVTAINNLGLFPKVVNRFSTEIPNGYVISTEPAANSEVSPGSTVIVYVCQNSTTKAVEVPMSIVGASISDATRYLVEVGLQVNNITYQASSAKAETVISSTPTPGSLIAEGTAVDLIVSNGAYYVDTTVYMDLLINNLPKRSFRYLVEVYANENEAPIHTAVIEPGETSFTMSVEVGDGIGSIKVKANNQNLRDITVNFDERTYYQRGIDYAVDLAPGYVSDDYEPPVSSQATSSWWWDWGYSETSSESSSADIWSSLPGLSSDAPPVSQ